MTYIMLKKILTLLYVRGKKRDLIKKKFLPKLNCPYPPPQQKSHGQTHREWGTDSKGSLFLFFFFNLIAFLISIEMQAFLLTLAKSMC